MITRERFRLKRATRKVIADEQKSIKALELTGGTWFEMIGWSESEQTSRPLPSTTR